MQGSHKNPSLDTKFIVLLTCVYYQNGFQIHSDYFMGLLTTPRQKYNHLNRYVYMYV